MNVEWDDAENDPLVGERRGIISRVDGDFSLPAPLLTNTDINSAANLSGKHLVDTHYSGRRFLEIREPIFNKSIDEVYTSSPENEDEISWINAQIARAKLFSDIVESLYTPKFVDVILTKQQIIRVVRTQVRTNLSIVSVPDGTLLDTDEMRDITIKLVDEIKKAGKRPFYSISIDTNHNVFKNKINAIKDLVEGVVVVGGNVPSHLDNLRELVELRNDPHIVRVLSNADKVFPTDSIKSLYPLCFLFADLYSVRYGIGFGKMSLERELTNAKRLDERSLGYLTISNHKGLQPKSLNCDCSVCKDREIDDIKVDFLGNLTSAFRVHEAVTVFNLSETVSSLFHNSQLLPFLKEKKHISPTIKNFINAKLTDFVDGQ